MNMSGYRADVCYARGSMWDSRTRPIVEISEIHGCWGNMAEVLDHIAVALDQLNAHGRLGHPQLASRGGCQSKTTAPPPP